MTMTSIFLAAAAPAGGGGGKEQMIMTLLFFGLIFVVLHFMIFRPQKKKEQQRREMLSKIDRGNKVITIGGIHGEVVAVKDKYVILQVDAERGTTIKFSRHAIHTIVTDATSDEEEEKR